MAEGPYPDKTFIEDDEKTKLRQINEKRLQRIATLEEIIANSANVPSVADPTLLEAVVMKDQRIASLQLENNELKKKVGDMQQQLENLLGRNKRLASILNESEKKRASIKRKCSELTRQVNELPASFESEEMDRQQAVINVAASMAGHLLQYVRRVEIIQPGDARLEETPYALE